MAPFFQHHFCNFIEIFHLLVGTGVGCKLNAVPIGIKEVDALEDAMVGGPQNIDARLYQAFLGREKLF